MNDAYTIILSYIMATQRFCVYEGRARWDHINEIAEKYSV